jgi:hypothetical protein
MQFSPQLVYLPFRSKYSQHFSQKPWVYVPPSKWETKFRTHTLLANETVFLFSEFRNSWRITIPKYSGLSSVDLTGLQSENTDNTFPNNKTDSLNISVSQSVRLLYDDGVGWVCVYWPNGTTFSPWWWELWYMNMGHCTAMTDRRKHKHPEKNPPHSHHIDHKSHVYCHGTEPRHPHDKISQS